MIDSTQKMMVQRDLFLKLNWSANTLQSSKLQNESRGVVQFNGQCPNSKKQS